MRTRRTGMSTAVIGLVVSLLSVLLLRIQAGNARVVVTSTAIIGPIMCAVGLFQVISGRDEERKGLGLVGFAFVILGGFVGALAVFGFGLREPTTKREPPITRVPDGVRELDDMSRALQSVTVTKPGP